MLELVDAVQGPLIRPTEMADMAESSPKIYVAGHNGMVGSGLPLVMHCLVWLVMGKT